VQLVGSPDESDLVDANVQPVKLVHAEDTEMSNGIKRGIAGRLFPPTRLARQTDKLVRLHSDLRNRLRPAVETGTAVIP
jgi:hypothetical protein